MSTPRGYFLRLAGVFDRFINYPAAGGIALIAAAAFALACANLPVLDRWYQEFLHLPVEIGIGAFAIEKSFLHFINDGLMTIFFLLVGLEIKREFLKGELSRFDQAILPIGAAISGMVVPAFIYVFINWGSPELMRGWAIPAATDIAFAMGVIILAGKRAPHALAVLLVAIAIIDDLGAIMIIALFYTEQLSLYSLSVALICLSFLVAFNLLGVRHASPYVLVGVVMWLFILESGVHSTLAGVALAMTIPLRVPGLEEKQSPLERFEHGLFPWVSFLIVPLFGFANAGIGFRGMALETLVQEPAPGIALGLVLGKQIGIFGTIFLMVRLGLAQKPYQCSWLQIYAMSLLCGIGFTMSLFIGTLAFPDGTYDVPVRIGVLGGSLVAALAGFLLLRVSAPYVSSEASAARLAERP